MLKGGSVLLLCREIEGANDMWQTWKWQKIIISGDIFLRFNRMTFDILRELFEFVGGGSGKTRQLSGWR